MNSRVLVLGLGRSGKAAKALLEHDGVEVVALDGEATFPEGEFDFAVVSPGISLTHPWIVGAARRGIPVKSELQLGCEELKRLGWKLLAVTGSKGKSSVVKVVADAINLVSGPEFQVSGLGLRAVACGNYGVPVCEVAFSEKRETRNQKQTTRWAVVEVSSFMMETTELPPDTFDAAAILNLQEDHLDRHGSVEIYHGLKRKLLTMAKERMGDGEGEEMDATASFLFANSYFDNDILRGNGAMAVGLMRVAGLNDATIARAFRAFEPLPHRMQEVGVFGGVRFVDDSKATSIPALIAGVTMAGAGIRLIAGGLAKGDDPKAALPRLTERVKKVYLIGDCAEKFFAAWAGSVDCEICGTLERAAEAAMREAAKGETVLLSPGTASFDQFKSFGERGEVFARLVKKERQNK